MNCPYCGSELDTGFNCPKCKAKSYKEIVSEYNTNGEKSYEKIKVKLVQPEPTTEQMLYWLCLNFPLVIEPNFDNLEITLIKGYKEYVFYGTPDQAINAAYEWAKEEV